MPSSKPSTAPDRPPTPAGLRERGKQRRTERILDAALALLREDPEQGLTVDRIAERAEVSPMTVYNLIGTREEMWRALADRALGNLAVPETTSEEPELRAMHIVDAIVKVLIRDAAVFKALLAGWTRGGRLLQHDPTTALVNCLTDAMPEGTRAKAEARRHGEVLAAGFIGTIELWASGVVSDRVLRRRTRAVVEVVFAAARSADVD